MKKAAMKEMLRVDELEENKVELKEAAENVFPIIVLAAIVMIFLLVLFLLRMYIRWSVSCPSKNRLDGKTVVITGANTGLGKATAMELARRGARLVLGCRDRIKGEAVARLVKKKTGNQNVFAGRLDLASMQSIKEFVEEFNRTEQKLHVLINNAGYLGPKATTEDGYERSLGVNYLGHFYLTLLLIDNLRKNAPSRIINVCSDSYTRGNLDFDDLAMQNSYDIYRAYTRSKLAQVIFNQELHRHFISGCVWSYAVHPGACCTDLLRNYPGMYGNILRVASRILFKSPEEGCQTIVYCAVADGLRDFAGKFFDNCKVVKLKDPAKDRTLATKLWNTSLTLTGLDSTFVMYGEEEHHDAPHAPAGEGASGAEGEAEGKAGDGSAAGPEKRHAAAAPQS